MSTKIYSYTTVGIDNLRTLTDYVIHRDFVLPSGFSWNGASVPRAAQFIMPRWGENSLAFLVHDFLYSKVAPHDITRAQADQILYEDLLSLGVGRARAYLVYKTVRVFGASYFRT